MGVVMSRLSKYFQSLNQDFGEFLALKGMFNIPMVRYPYILLCYSMLSLVEPKYSVFHPVGAGGAWESFPPQISWLVPPPPLKEGGREMWSQ